MFVVLRVSDRKFNDFRGLGRLSHVFRRYCEVGMTLAIYVCVDIDTTLRLAKY